MVKKEFEVRSTPMPERAELHHLSRAPRLVLDISRQLRNRARRGDPDGVMAQHAARVLMSHLAVCGETNQLLLAQKTHFSTPTVSVLLRRMEAEGYVSRTESKQDRRVMLVSLTEKGIAFDREHLSRICENDRLAMQGFSEEEKNTLCLFLDRMYENLRGEK